jgi:hypothetical protein
MESVSAPDDTTQTSAPVPADSSDKSRRIDELVHRPEFEALVREAIRIVQASSQQTPLTKKRKPQKDQRVRVRVRVPCRPRVRSDQQLAKRRTQRLQRQSYVRASARAEGEIRKKRSAKEVAALAQKRYSCFRKKLNHVRLKELDERFAELLQAEEEFPPPLPDMKDLYSDFYNEMTELTQNITCASCGCIEHHRSKFVSVPFNDSSLRHLQVDPSLVPFNFQSGVAEIDTSHVMIDPNGIVDGTSLSVCHLTSCPLSLSQITAGSASSHHSSRVSLGWRNY